MPKDPWPISDRNVRRRLYALLLCLTATIAAASASHHVTAADAIDRPRIERLPNGWDARPEEDSVYFATTPANLDEDALRVIRRHVAKLEANPQLNLTLVAHSDELGSTALEIARGQDRLNVVQRIFEEARIAPRRIRSINFGAESSPAENCIGDACRRLRRRIDFLFHR